MFPSWRMQLGAARRALRQGQLEQAQQMLAAGDLHEFCQAQPLAAELAQRYIARARGRLVAGHSAAGWHDLLEAERIAGNDQQVAPLRQDYVQRNIDRAVELLADGRTAAARAELEKLHRRGVATPDVRQLAELAERLAAVEQMLAAGKSPEAEPWLAEMAAKLRSSSGRMVAGGPRVAARVDLLAARCNEHRQLSRELHAATESGDWHAVLATAEQLLSLAARDPVARSARRRAWRAVGLDATQAYDGGRLRAAACLSLRSTDAVGGRVNQGADDTMTGSANPNRLMLWVDAVGGYLVCLDDEVVLGQPVPGVPVAVPISADLSRRHAVLRREAGTYTLEPLGAVAVDGRPLSGPMVLGNDHEIQLGENVRLKFTRPHALSATARLTPVSGHRTTPRADAVLLMADSCVLGPKRHAHVECPHWPGEVILFRQRGLLHCRSLMPLAVDGVAAEGPTPLAAGTRLEGEAFALSLEGV